MIDKITAFIKTKTGKIFLLAVIIVLIIISGLTIFLISRNNTKNDSDIDIIVEPEMEPGLTLVGFQVFYDYGFSAVQQQTIYSTVFRYVTDFNPNILLVEYVNGSFSYLPDESSQSSFKLSSDIGTDFIVKLNTFYSYTDIQVEISPL